MFGNWVVNSSPLILLGKIGGLAWLPKLADELLIPTGVAVEIQAGTDDPARRWLLQDGLVHVRDVRSIPPLISAWDLGRGETEVLAYAWTHHDYSAVLDDRAARQCALALQIPLRGTLGVALLAKQAGLISQFAPVIKALQHAGLRITPQIIAQALRLANEYGKHQ
jgi:predicted nucleic acid-binding protein